MESVLKKIIKKKNLFIDTVFIILFVILMCLFKGYFDFILMFFLFLTIFALWITDRVKLFKYLFLSFVISFVWSNMAKHQYIYNFNYLKVLGLEIIPFFGWGLGLFALYLKYLKFRELFKLEKGYMQILLFTAIYWTLLIFIETFAYYYIGIHDIATSGHKGIPFFKCIHAPLWMQISYFSMGFIYFVLIMIINKKVIS